PVADWTRRMVESVQPHVESNGFLMCPYFAGVNAANPAAGISIDSFTPRYSHAYFGSINRPAMLIETHMLKPYRTRVEATYSLLKRTIQYCGESGADLRRAVQAADSADRLSRPGASVVLTSRVASESR